MAVLRLFASIRESAGNKSQLDFPAQTVGELLELAGAELGDLFTEQIPVCRVWLNGEPTSLTQAIGPEDEVALLPPVSGGSGNMENNGLNVGLISFHTSPFSQPGEGDSGGMNVYVQQLAYALAHRGNNCTIYVRKTSPDQPANQHIEPGVTISYLPAGDYDLSLQELPEVVDEFTDALTERLTANQERTDILHANYWLSGRVGHQLKHEMNLPLITTFHTLGRVKENIGEWVDVRRTSEEEKIANCSEAISVTSSAEAADLMQLYSVDAKRIHQAEAGVNHAFFSPGNQEEARKALNLKKDVPVILFVGRIQPLKQFTQAVATLAIIKETYKEAELIVVGGPSGPEGESALAEALELAQELKVRDQIRMVAPQPHHLLATYYRAADLVMVPSLSESFGLVALEAMACGIPVVAAKVGGLKNIVEHGKTGILVEANTPTAFATATQSLLSNRVKSAEMALDAAQKARSYSWHATATQLEKLYASCLSASLLEC